MNQQKLVTKSMKRQDILLQYVRFQVIASDTQHRSYFVGCFKPSATQPDDFCWCTAARQLYVGDLVRGYLSESLDVKNLPLLVLE
ncbi:hypothetical protein F7734_37935 [Scytonema sp. UIC 10036]|uniref:hypothetical protein n=1 Tax=Scytonema sp. UIC 10036 TaxID=2304196 RepID=UPI0012DA3156|nr:hypothetical protein [Scytonema sp. UIC 10036]MUG97784.1 hypothetical protein [Scytonema sp. UIC 10036]